MKKLLVLILPCLLLGCSGKQYEKWQIPTEKVNQVTIESYFDDKLLVSEEESILLLESYNSLDNMEIIDEKIGEGFTKIYFNINEENYCINIIDSVAFVIVNDNWYITDSNQKFFDVFRNVCEKYDVKRPSLLDDQSYAKANDNSYLVNGNASMKIILDEFSAASIQDNSITVNEFLKENIDVVMNKEYKYENLTFKIIEIDEENIISLLMYINE